MMRCLILIACLGLPAAAQAQPLAVMPQPPASQPPEDAAELEEINRLVQQIVLKHLPNEFENTRQWGGTKERWDGLHIWRDGLRIKTKRRKKAVNHGNWKRYRAYLVNPREELQVEISRVRLLDRGRIAFQLAIVTRLGTFARLSQWRWGVQLISLSANAQARVRLTLSCEVGSRLDFARLPPDVVVVPQVTAAQLELLEFRLERLSELSGPLAKELGESLHNVLQDELDERRHKLRDRINRQLEKHQDDLRFSVHELSERGWQELLEFLRLKPEPADGSAGQAGN